ncbi:bifunctional hydroxymethylpyrimidine kinase/phosphomethylpyrimidine kinase [Georgenia ruanii]|uniref:Bifunctional hydroxymethylpyrimidine kinase/phosphomethylpyrimidine kinase n=1 Tax=Georgenia ruanii TaxID=348442 RepID=A0A7J9URR8_9MICO|nr:bifunctional hydroxymethylpyrimidine kinase/phosphomethylpyrimidine kinase [Georgenia ruanii]MPV87212.1 bifunctional hydroxymethylpyrimidine kinase/phosphomethylpyrimidine kinase [Georgenia ruanii]
MSRPLVALTIAGSDPSGGAGIQADLKTFSALGAYGTAVLTALTAQSTRGVTGVHTVPPGFVREQLDTLLVDVPVDAMKIGMLAGAPTVEAVREFLAEAAPPVVVLDPVMVSTSGDRLLDDGAVSAMRRLLPHASVITPNLPEAAVLLGRDEARDLDTMRAQACALADLGAQRVLLKGGHLTGPDAIDLWVDAAGERVLRAARVPTRNTHGTGCSLSSALAVLAARLGSWPDAAAGAKSWLTGALAAGDSLDIGAGPGPVHHFYELWSTR